MQLHFQGYLPATRAMQQSLGRINHRFVHRHHLRYSSGLIPLWKAHSLHVHVVLVFSATEVFHNTVNASDDSTAAFRVRLTLPLAVPAVPAVLTSLNRRVSTKSAAAGCLPPVFASRRGTSAHVLVLAGTRNILRTIARVVMRHRAGIDEGISCGASQAPLTRQTMHRTARTRVPMNDSKGVAFYASGNIAGEALRLYSTDLWTEACAAKAVRDDVQRMYAFCLGFRPTVQ